uniref:Uncharacterized protein n=1 Tax=Thermorudis peleae TaxID=1382356 RepID=A0A831TF95_9BACT
MGRSCAIERGNGGQHSGEHLADPGATGSFLSLVSRYRDSVGQRRFVGEDPVVHPLRDAPEEIAAAAIAAERLGGLFRLDGKAISPAEDLAVAELDAGLRALANWDVRLARWRLAIAAEHAHLPEQQQRVSLAQALAQTVRDVLYEYPGQSRVKPEAPVVALGPTLDRLTKEELDFYVEEAKRLAGLWRQAKEDVLLWTGWALTRVRTILRDGEPDAALAWLLRIYRRNRDRLTGDDYLERLVRRAEATFRLLLLAEGEDEAELRKLAEDASPHDLLVTTVAMLSRAWDTDVVQVSNRFALVLYQRTELNAERSS